MMAIEESLEAAARELEILTPGENDEVFRQKIIAVVRELIHSDFPKLVNILYRMDVSETKLKQVITEKPGSDAAVIITDLIIERQAEKIKTRREFKKRDDDIDEKEKW